MPDNIETLLSLKKERNAVILAHYYQTPDIQDIADFLGDSLELSRKACNVDADVIVFCGVRFMAESAKILNPSKTVLLPVAEAGCPLADMVTPEDIKELRVKYPDATIVCYVNTSAQIKALSDICCTSSNAVKVIKSLPQKRVVFIPDKNLGHYISRFVPEKEIILWNGYCCVHEFITPEHIAKAKEAHPQAEVLVHPECRPEVIDIADFTGSTSAILKRAKESSSREFIIGTESGIIHQLEKENPDKSFYLVHENLICRQMKRTMMQDVTDSLKYMKNVIEVDEDIRLKAYNALDKMIAIK